MGMMQSPLLLVVLVAALVLLLCPVRAAGASCQASTSFEETSVTCNFSRDLSESSHNFNVQFYYPDLQADPPEMVLMCNWKTSTEMQCKKASDVRFDKNVTNKVTFLRDQSVRKAGGKYVCQVVPTLGDPVVPCMLAFKGDLPTPTKPTPTLKTHPFLLEEIRKLSERTLVVSVVALVVSCFVLIVFLTYCCRRRIAEKVPVLANVLGQGTGERASGEDGKGQDPCRVEEGRQTDQKEEHGTINNLSGKTQEKKRPLFGLGKSKSSQKDGKLTPEAVPMIERVSEESRPVSPPPEPPKIQPEAAPLQQPAMSGGRTPDNSFAENKPESKKERKAREKEEQERRKKQEKEEKERKKKEEKVEKEMKKKDSNK